MMWNQEDVWAAAAAAYRINGNRYLKQSYDPDTNDVVTANKLLVATALVNDPTMVTDEDRTLGVAARRAISRDITNKLLADTPLNEWERTISNCLNTESWTKPDRYRWAIIASQISAYFRLLDRREVIRTLENGFLADIGTKTSATCRVISANWSHSWCTWNILAQTTDNRLVSFNYREELGHDQEIVVTGKVKAHRHNNSYQSDVTQLTRVRVVRVLLVEAE